MMMAVHGFSLGMCVSYYWVPPVRAHHISCSHENVTESHRIVTPADFTFRSAYNNDERVRLIGISAIVCDINV